MSKARNLRKWGQKGQKPLNLVSVTLANGDNVENADAVPTDPQFILQFDKNVVDSLMWEDNSKCISLISQDNENIPVRVTKGDDDSALARKVIL